MEKPGNLTRSFLTENNRLLIEEACLDGIEHSNIVAEIRGKKQLQGFLSKKYFRRRKNR